MRPERNEQVERTGTRSEKPIEYAEHDIHGGSSGVVGYHGQNPLSCQPFLFDEAYGYLPYLFFAQGIGLFVVENHRQALQRNAVTGIASMSAKD
jgi:hypothetical protein